MKFKTVRAKIVEIVLENCEVFTFNADDVSIVMDGLSFRQFKGLAVYRVKKASIKIDGKAKASGGWKDERWQDRICRDITQVWIGYDNGESQGFFIPWGDVDEYENSLEKDSIEKTYTGMEYVYTIDENVKK